MVKYRLEFRFEDDELHRRGVEQLNLELLDEASKAMDVIEAHMSQRGNILFIDVQKMEEEEDGN